MEPNPHAQVATKSRVAARQRLTEGNRWVVWNPSVNAVQVDHAQRLVIPNLEDAVQRANVAGRCFGVAIHNLIQNDEWRNRLFDATQPYPCGKLMCLGCQRANNLKPCPNPECNGRIRKAQRKPCSLCHKHPSDSNKTHITSPEEYAKAITEVKKHLDKLHVLMEQLNTARPGALLAFHLLVNPYSGERLTSVDQRKKENGLVMSGWYGDCSTLPAEALHRRDGRINAHPKDKDRLANFVQRNHVFTWANLLAGVCLREENATELQLKSQATKAMASSCPMCPSMQSMPDEHPMLHHHMAMHPHDAHGQPLPIHNGVMAMSQQAGPHMQAPLILQQNHDGTDTLTMVPNPTEHGQEPPAVSSSSLHSQTQPLQPIHSQSQQILPQGQSLTQADTPMNIVLNRSEAGTQVQGQPLVNIQVPNSMTPMMYEPTQPDVSHYQTIANAMGGNMYQYYTMEQPQPGQEVMMQQYMAGQPGQVVPNAALSQDVMQAPPQSQEALTLPQDAEQSQAQVQAPLQAQEQTIPPHQQSQMNQDPNEDSGNMGMPPAKMARREDTK
eukprot:TRINITY_DN2117_c0_g1_i1.p1 TRINITY_DN2117_c0_g1~~TRINITY_DN2117_c0_g1_i1.p1  ORF type:complete len:555 (+),score=133.98 TRINITY_DN2117_c0_g1_i1:48-1712(+)